MNYLEMLRPRIATVIAAFAMTGAAAEKAENGVTEKLLSWAIST